MKIKKFLASIFCMVAVCVIVFTASAASINFSDVKSGKWYAEHINYAVENNIFVGTSATKFSPENKMTRAQFVQVFANLSKIDTTNKKVTTQFTDVPYGKWYTPAVKWASENGIVSGMGDGTFAPEKPVTREQMCLMLVNYVEKFQKSTLQAKKEIPVFQDNAKIALWAKEAVYKCAKAGLVNGMGNNTFSPKGNTTRAQGATLFSNFHKYLAALHTHKYTDGKCVYCGEKQILNPKTSLKLDGKYYYESKDEDGTYSLRIYTFQDQYFYVTNMYTTNKAIGYEDEVITYNGKTYYAIGFGGQDPTYVLTDTEVIVKYDDEVWCKMIVNYQNNLEITYPNTQKGDILVLAK